MTTYENLRKGERGAWISITAYIILSFAKLLIGYIGNSTALKADGLNNTTDIIASVAVLIGLRISQKPPDGDHTYGHMRAETVASLIASFIMAVVGIQVLFSAAKRLFEPTDLAPSPLTAAVAVVSGIVMLFVYRYNMKLSKEINSTAVKAAALDNRSDAYVSFGAAIGIGAASLGYPIIDSITAMIVGMIIIKTAYEIFAESVMTLTDGFDEHELKALSDVVKHVDGVIELIDIKGRNHGSMILVDLTVTVDPQLNVWDSHHITENIEKEIRLQKPTSIVLVHIEPEGLLHDHSHNNF
ncbi:cation diffusion facilitator family transporter [Kurthia sibirica]|uniref:Transporter n=1 Tax=Kurthia sibirica TaxID=202750 RepID=A0A2U3AFQ1_9BACL|nr:cation diffusion facilitator family transporter [Kurthia sibirica]PWI23382.1 transporter [Kurthia sibirica]GEK35381.1 transporter [Kurthia sibirica]